MAGEGQLKEQANQQWERLDMEGHKIINDLLTADVEKVEWPEHRTKIHQEKGNQSHQSCLQFQDKKRHIL